MSCGITWFKSREWSILRDILSLKSSNRIMNWKYLYLYKESLQMMDFLVFSKVNNFPD